MDTEPATGVPVMDEIASLILSMKIRQALKDMKHRTGVDEATWEVPTHDGDGDEDDGYESDFSGED